MGGAGERVDRAARDIYEEWSACHHFSLYEDVPEVLRELQARGLTIGLISNTQRCLASFQSHFALDGVFAVRVSSAAHGYMKPHPSIFQTALEQAGSRRRIDDGRRQPRARILGARRLGMRAVLVSTRRHLAGVSRRCAGDLDADACWRGVTRDVVRVNPLQPELQRSTRGRLLAVRRLYPGRHEASEHALARRPPAAAQDADGCGRPSALRPRCS